MPQGKEAVDIVYSAIAKTLDGSRGWDPEQEPDLERHLRSVCDSELNHLAVGFENRRMTRESTMAPLWIEGAAERPLETTIASPLPEPPAALALKAAGEEAEAFTAALATFLADDPPLAKVASLVLDGTAKPADIAASLSVPVDEVYNIRKRLQRRLPAFLAAWRDDIPESGRGGVR
jgi:hypothetical protein